MNGSFWYVIPIGGGVAGGICLLFLIRDFLWVNYTRSRRRSELVSLRQTLTRKPSLETLRPAAQLLSEVSVDDYCTDRGINGEVNSLLGMVERTITPAPALHELGRAVTLVAATSASAQDKRAACEITVDTAVQCLKRNRVAAALSTIKDHVITRTKRVSPVKKPQDTLIILAEHDLLSLIAFDLFTEVLSWDFNAEPAMDVASAENLVHQIAPHLAELDRSVELVENLEELRELLGRR